MSKGVGRYASAFTPAPRLPVDAYTKLLLHGDGGLLENAGSGGAVVSAEALWSGSTKFAFDGANIGAPSDDDEAIYVTEAIPSSSFPLELTYKAHSNSGQTLDNSGYCVGLFDANELSNFDHTNNAGGMNAAGRNAWGAYFDSWSPGSRLLYGNEYARRTVAEHSRASHALHVTAMAYGTLLSLGVLHTF